MTTFPGSPRTLRGALISVDPDTRALAVLAFQYNPHTLTRSFEIKGVAGGVETGQLAGPPAETISVEVVLDATDQLEAGQGERGVAPQLAALQALVTPDHRSLQRTLELAASGAIEVLPPPAPITLFVWGADRVLPVAVTELSFSEEAFDTALNPTLVRASLGLRVLTSAELPAGHPAHALAVAGQVGREGLAEAALTSSLTGVLGSDVRLL